MCSPEERALIEAEAVAPWRAALEQTNEALTVARGLNPTTIEPDPFAYDHRPVVYHGDKGHGPGMQCATCDYNAAFDVLAETNTALLAQADKPAADTEPTADEGE